MIKYNYVEYPDIKVLSLTRVATIVQGENAGYSYRTHTRIQDTKGPFISYELVLGCKNPNSTQRAALYEALINEPEFGVWELPYNGSTYTFKGWISSQISDRLKRMRDGNQWDTLSFTVESRKAKNDEN